MDVELTRENVLNAVRTVLEAVEKSNYDEYFFKSKMLCDMFGVQSSNFRVVVDDLMDNRSTSLDYKTEELLEWLESKPR